jgi:hypothetical protein
MFSVVRNWASNDGSIELRSVGHVQYFTSGEISPRDLPQEASVFKASRWSGDCLVRMPSGFVLSRAERTVRNQAGDQIHGVYANRGQRVPVFC